MTGGNQRPDRRIGLIGVGLVGGALSRRLLAAGYDVIAFDTAPGQLDHLRALGGVAAGSAREAAAGARRVLLSLPTSGIAATVLAEILPCLAAGAIVMDTTTGEPDEIAAFGVKLASAGVEYIDATIGGSSQQVQAGEAIMICGGDAKTFAACQDLLAVCSRQAFHVGPCGAGARMKLVFNLVLGLNRAALAEGLSYASAVGIDPAAALAILKAGPAYSRVMDIKGHKMIAADFSVEARLSQHLKDVRLILASGVRRGLRLPLSEAHRTLLEKAEACGYGAADNSAIVKAFEREPSA